MIRFGNIKSRFESLFVESYKKPSFKENLNFFKKNIISNNVLRETYYIYDEIYGGKGFDKTKSELYLNETTRILKEKLISENNNLKKIDSWLDSKLGKKVTNLYEDLDCQIYDRDNLRSVEKIIESKSNLVDIISKVSKPKSKNRIDVPISSTLNISNRKLNEYLSTLDESVVGEIKKLTSINRKELIETIDTNRNEVIKKLEGNLSSSNDEELKTKITETINKLNNSKYSYLTLYTIKDLNEKI